MVVADNSLEESLLSTTDDSPPVKAPRKTSRKPGRPFANDSQKISRGQILRTALRLTVTMPLQDVTIVTVAKASGVTPALIHYYLGGRDWLTSGVMNLFYKELVRKLPEPTGEWAEDLLAFARTMFDQYNKYAGISAYAVSNSRFRVFQLTSYNERDFGVDLLERLTGIVRLAGLGSERTGIYANQFMEFLISAAHSTALHIYPKSHLHFLEAKAASLDPKRYPNIAYTQQSPLMIDGEVVFNVGCEIFVRGIRDELSRSPAHDAAIRSPAVSLVPDDNDESSDGVAVAR